MSLAEELARLVASGEFHAVRTFSNSQPDRKAAFPRTQTVYSVGEAIVRRGNPNDAKLEAGPI
jgi:hypothetical protein